jgi:hypothetical protein
VCWSHAVPRSSVALTEQQFHILRLRRNTQRITVRTNGTHARVGDFGSRPLSRIREDRRKRPSPPLIYYRVIVVRLTYVFAALHAGRHRETERERGDRSERLNTCAGSPTTRRVNYIAIKESELCDEIPLFL